MRDHLVKWKLRKQSGLCQARSLFCIVRVASLSECDSENRWMNFRDFLLESLCSSEILMVTFRVDVLTLMRASLVGLRKHITAWKVYLKKRR